MKGGRNDRVHIWPQMENEADEPKTGWFAIRLGKNQPERALRVISEAGYWFAYLDGRQLARPTTDWTHAFGTLRNGRDILTGMVLTEQEYKDLLQRRSQDAAAGIDADKPINLHTARVPF